MRFSGFALLSLLLAAVTGAAPVESSTTANLEERQNPNAEINLFTNSCTAIIGVPFLDLFYASPGPSFDSGCKPLDKVYSFYTLGGGKYLGFRIWSDPYCLTLATIYEVASSPGCYTANGGIRVVSYHGF